MSASRILLIVFFLAFLEPKEEAAQKSFSMEGFANPLSFSTRADSSALFSLSFCAFCFPGSLMRGSSSLFGGAGGSCVRLLFEGLIHPTAEFQYLCIVLNVVFSSWSVTASLPSSRLMLPEL